MSAEHLRRSCRAEIGRSPMRHLAHLRMRAAATLLATDSCTIDSLAKRLGYASAFALSAASKRATGVPPGAYRAASLAGRPPPAR
jgi:AraC-like DNA-binding protein